MASAWGKAVGAGVGVWAQEVEEAEAAEQSKSKAADINAEVEGDFPSLAAAMAAKPKKSKNKTATKLTLSEFTTGFYIGPGAKSRQPETKGLTTDEMLMLPTGPRERTAEELERERSGGLGGGFRAYGRDRDRDNNNTRERRRDSVFDTDEPSRADTSSHWGSSKSSSSSSFGRGDRDRDRDRDKEEPSRADGTDDWVAAKKFTPSLDRKFGDGFGGGGGGGFVESGHSRADESRNWAAQKQQMGSRGFDSYGTRRGGGGRSGFDFFSRDGDGDRWNRRDDNGNGGAGRQRLVLQPRSAPVEGGSNYSSLGETGVVRSRASNPFGEAKPREQVLEEKGMDWKKIDEDLELRGKRDADLGARSNNYYQADDGHDKTEQDWRKTNNNTDGKRPEETHRAANGDDSSQTEFEHLETISNQSDESDDGELVKNEKIEQLRNDLSQKANV